MKFVGICSPENPVSPVQPNTDNLFAQAGVPLLAIPLDLSQFGHRQNIAVQDCPASGDTAVNQRRADKTLAVPIGLQAYVLLAPCAKFYSWRR